MKNKTSTKIHVNLLGLFFFLSIVLFILSQCSNSDDPINDVGIDVSGIAEGSYITTNSSDPEFVKLVTDKGEIVSVFGTRDENGLPELVQQINITDENGEEYFFYYDNNKRIEKIIADNGTVFNYEWLSDEKAVLYIDCNDGTTQINTEIELGDLGQNKITQTNTSSSTRNSINNIFNIEFSPFVDEEPNLLKNQTNYRVLNGTTYDIRPTSCGAPTSIQPLRINIYDQAGLVNLKQLNTQFVGTGHYTTTLPSGLAPTIDPQAAVEKLTSILTTYCDVEGLAGQIISPATCAFIAAKLASTGIGVSAAPAVGGACVGITAALKIYCATLGKSGEVGLPSTMDKINEQKLLENFKLTGDMRMHVVFRGIPNNITKGFTITEGVSRTLNIELIDDPKPRINSIVLSPSSPAAGQDYIISASVFCATVGSTVNISMLGSDGWTANSDYPISDPSQSAGTFTMTVPGAETGVTDQITVEIKTPDGQTITRYASLIFGD